MCVNLTSVFMQLFSHPPPLFHMTYMPLGCHLCHPLVYVTTNHSLSSHHLFSTFLTLLAQGGEFVGGTNLALIALGNQSMTWWLPIHPTLEPKSTHTSCHKRINEWASCHVCNVWLTQTALPPLNISQAPEPCIILYISSIISAILSRQIRFLRWTSGCAQGATKPEIQNYMCPWFCGFGQGTLTSKPHQKPGGARGNAAHFFWV